MFHLHGSADLTTVTRAVPTDDLQIERDPARTEFDKLVLKCMWESRDREHQQQSRERRVGDLT